MESSSRGESVFITLALGFASNDSPAAVFLPLFLPVVQFVGTFQHSLDAPDSDVRHYRLCLRRVWEIAGSTAGGRIE
jgi:hypothetical protein